VEVSNATGVLAAPTNFFAANSNLLNQAVNNNHGTGGGGASSNLAGDTNYSGMLNLLDFGAVAGTYGSHGTDNYAAITNALAIGAASGGTLHAPAGFYYSSKPVIIPLGIGGIVGDMPTVLYVTNQIVDIQAPTPLGGTWFDFAGSNGFSGYGLRGVQFRNFGIMNFGSNAMKFGGTNVEGLNLSYCGGLILIGTNTVNGSDTGWENWNGEHNVIDGMQVFNVNTILRVVQLGDTFQSGNDEFYSVYGLTYPKSAANGNSAKPGIAVQSLTGGTNVGRSLGAISFFRPQVNSYNGDGTGTGVQLQGTNGSASLAGVNFYDLDVEGPLAYSIYADWWRESKLTIATCDSAPGTVLLTTNSYNNTIESLDPETLVTNLASPNNFYGIFTNGSTTNQMPGAWSLPGQNYFTLGSVQTIMAPTTASPQVNVLGDLVAYAGPAGSHGDINAARYMTAGSAFIGYELLNTTPSQNLVIYNPQWQQGIQLTISNAGLALQIQAPSGNTEVKFGLIVDGTNNITNNLPAYVVTNNDPANLTFGGNLDLLGQLGIGTATPNPSYALDVNGSASVSNNLSWAGSAIGNGASITNLNANNIGQGTLAYARLPSGVFTNNDTVNLALYGELGLGMAPGANELAVSGKVFNAIGGFYFADSTNSTAFGSYANGSSYLGYGWTNISGASAWMLGHSAAAMGIITPDLVVSELGNLYSSNGTQIAGPTGLNASALAGGTVPLAVLPAVVVTNGSTPTLNGAVITNGVTNLSLTASSLTMTDANHKMTNVTLGTGLSFSGTTLNAGGNNFTSDFNTNGSSRIALTNVNLANASGTLGYDFLPSTFTTFANIIETNGSITQTNGNGSGTVIANGTITTTGNLNSTGMTDSGPATVAGLTVNGAGSAGNVSITGTGEFMGNANGVTNISPAGFSYGTNGSAASGPTNYVISLSTNTTTLIAAPTNVWFTNITGGPGLFSIIVSNQNAAGTVINIGVPTNAMPLNTNNAVLGGNGSTNWVWNLTNEPGRVWYFSGNKLTSATTFGDIIYSAGTTLP
jgi:hypothetical protein